MRIISTLLALMMTVSHSYAAVHFTPILGYTFGGEVANSEDQTFDIEPGANYAFSIAADLPKVTQSEQGRIGLFYSQQNSHIEEYNNDLTLRNLHFQSAIYYTATPELSPFLGLSIGATQLDPQWSGIDYRFSSSIYTGLEYQLTDRVSLQGQFRWMGTFINNKSYTLCQVSGSSTCYIRYEGDWLGQVQSNIGVVIRL
ncbi:porin family protein [Vibrio sp. JC009]|uniref:porin family protein n=1 Tax=Vibrio sp. JC009 TaxID=2912314 RepID=UPI0023B080D4|nr:porin family protein [Vibrio sp. JC009]WED22694.1 porin family protein [Vibrio sp. JC009]